MPAARYDITVEQGATYVLTIRFWADAAKTVQRNLTGVDFRMQVRLRHASEDVVWEGTLTGGTADGITCPTPTNGQVTITIPAADTAEFAASCHVYDLELVSAGVVDRVIEGKLFVSPEVTRA